MIKCQQICTDDSGIEDEDDASLMTSLNYPHRSKDELDSSHLSLDSVSNALGECCSLILQVSDRYLTHRWLPVHIVLFIC